MHAKIHGLGVHVLERRKQIYTGHSTIKDGTCLIKSILHDVEG